ncbi:hypothetical protein [Frigidibacter sp.]|uniref:hypothetical protein n=1 Tax=Frigidibacter sp. TaxID=2586418 RepID=UPI0027353C66|nr:hypothetical protein [Frigidibacter sp.]MDP3339756.1 hypothetical protein [Frigidibacter sp.]
MRHWREIEIWARCHPEKNIGTLARRAFDRCDDDGIAGDDIDAMTELQTQFEWEQRRSRRRKKR